MKNIDFKYKFRMKRTINEVESENSTVLHIRNSTKRGSSKAMVVPAMCSHANVILD